MDPGTKRGLFIALLIACLGLAACVVRTAPGHRHRRSHVVDHDNGKHKHKKHKKARSKHKDHR